MLTGGGGERTVSAGPNAKVEIDGDSATIVANMDQPPEGRVYEVWIVPKGAEKGAPPEPTNVLFIPRSDGSVEAAIPGSADDIAPGAGQRRAARRVRDARRARSSCRPSCPKETA